MIKVFQWIAQVFHGLCQGSILPILNLLLQRCKNLWVDVSLHKAIGQVLEKKHRRSLKWHWISASLVFLLIVFSHYPQSLIGVAQVITSIQTPLSTKGSQIVDATGKQVLIRGVNWFGMETDTHAPDKG